MATYSGIQEPGTFDGWFFARTDSRKTIVCEADDAFSFNPKSGDSISATTNTPGAVAQHYKPAVGSTTMYGSQRCTFSVTNNGGTGYFTADGFDCVFPFLIKSGSDVGVSHIDRGACANAIRGGPLCYWVNEIGKSATVDAPWLQITCGYDGAYFVLEENDTGLERTANVTFSAFSGATATLTLRQSADYNSDVPSGGEGLYFRISPPSDYETLNYWQESCVFLIETNAHFVGELSDELKSWGASLSYEKREGDVTEAIVRIPNNESPHARSGIVGFHSCGSSYEYLVRQQGADGNTGDGYDEDKPYVRLEKTNAVVSSRESSVRIRVDSNDAAGVLSTESSTPWIKSSVNEGELFVEVDSNAGDRNRAGTVRVEGSGGGYDVLSVLQKERSVNDNTRLIPWSVADGAAYVLLFATTDGTQTLTVYDATTKESVATFDTDYPNESLGKIRHKASNDVVWLTHPERPVRWLRREDTTETYLGNPVYRFTYEDYPFKVEPMLDYNVGSGTRLSLTAEPWEVSAYTYRKGDIVFNNQTYAVLGVATEWTTRNAGYEWTNDIEVEVRIDAEPESFVAGSYVELHGVVAWWNVLAGNEDRPFSVENPKGEVLSAYNRPGQGTFVRIAVGSHSYRGEATAEPTSLGVREAELNNPKLLGVGESPGFYECIADNNGKPLSDAEYWKRTFCVAKELSLSASDPAFFPGYGGTSDMAYSAWRVGQHLSLTAKAYAAESGNWDYKAEGATSNPMLAFGTVTLKTEGGVWSGRLVLEMSVDDGKTWEFVDAVVSENGSSNPQINVDIDEIGALVRVRCDRREKATTRQALIPSDGGLPTYKDVESDTGCKWMLTCEGYSDVFVKILSFSGDGAVVECISGCPYPVSTTTWAEGAWNSRYGFPHAVEIHEERLCFAGNVKKPTTLWCSAINHYDDFRRGTLDTSSISVKPTSHSYGRAVWLASGSQLIMGTTLEEFAIGSRDSVAAMSGRNIVAKASASYGSADFDCVQSKSGIFSVLPGGKKIGVLSYDAVEEYTGTEVSQKAADLLSSGIKELAYAKAPQDTLFALCNDGSVAALTYDFAQNVAGWSRLEVLNGVEALCVVRRGGHDILCVVVNDGGELILGEIDPENDVWTDNGSGYESLCFPMPMEVNGQAQGATTKVVRADVYLARGNVFEYSFDGKMWHKHGARGKDGRWAPLFGRIELRQNSDWKDEATVMFRTDYAAPFTISAVGAQIKRGG